VLLKSQWAFFVNVIGQFVRSPIKENTVLRTSSIALLFMVGLEMVFTSSLRADQRVISHKTSQAPTIDGLEKEDVWNNVTAVTTYDPIADVDISIKSVYNASTIFFLVSYPDEDESRTHRNWVWNPEQEMYEEGPEREDVFVFKWKLDENIKDLSIYSDMPYEADVWYWKACRTDAQGFADDKIQRLFNYPAIDTLEVISKSGKPMYIKREGDAGRSTYKTKIFVDYQGDVVRRYTLRMPQASRADILAKGVWADGRWTIEFARALDTGKHDDVIFSDLQKNYGFGVSRYEIAGRPIEHDADQPLFGSGDITEALTLEFK
jgi:hypothetical protein